MNKAATAAAEPVEESGSTKGNTASKTRPGRRAGQGAPSALDRVRQVAQQDKEARFTALLHHVTVDRLRAAYRAISPHAAPGVDKVTWASYGEALEDNLRDLHDRVHAGRYRAKPSRRVYIPKPDGRQRPLGVSALEDKIVQRAVVEVLNAIYEADFRGFSYGFRPGRGPHDALDALSVGIRRKKVNWVLDADIRDFFTSLDRDWLKRFLEHRIGDRRVLRLIDKWLAAGVIEHGAWSPTRRGSVQGASVSPLLANVYLHYVFDLWADWWRHHHARGDVIIIRFADDVTIGFQYRDDAERFWAELRDRFAKFSLELHPDKTRLIEFGRFAAANRARRGLGRPETFDFLGFTHMCATSKTGQFWIRRVTIKKRMRAKLKSLNVEIKRRRHLPIPVQGAWLAAVVRGHQAYYAVPGNTRAVSAFSHEVTRLWRNALQHRSQRGWVTWDRMARIRDRWLPPVRDLHPFPTVRFAANHPR